MLFVAPTRAQQVDTTKLGGIDPRAIGPAGMSGRVTAIDVSPTNKDVWYIGTGSGGLWKTTNGGTTFEPIFTDQPATSIGDVTVHPENPDIIWVGTGEGNPRNSSTGGNGVYKSTDGGKTWTHLGLEETRSIHRVLLHPDNPKVAYIGAQGATWGYNKERGVYKTTDGGKTWEKILYVNKKTGVADMVMDPQNPDKLIVAMWQYRRWPWFFKSGGPGSALYMTTDGGENWNKLGPKNGLPSDTLGRIGLAIAPSNPDRVYAYIEKDDNALYRSSDGGHHWKMVNSSEGIGSRPFYYADLRVDPQNPNRVYSVAGALRVSEDAGESFRVISDEIHPDHHALWINPEDPSFLIDGNDGGLAISHDYGKTWRVPGNLPLAQFYHINVDDAFPYHVYGGMQDNGSWRGPNRVYRGGGVRNVYWNKIGYGDGFDVVPDPQNPRFGYSMWQGGNLLRYDVKTGGMELIRPQPDSVTDPTKK
ncbi:MAG: WD40/YVTN/BNR-like repeat-containing protein, partial [Salinibacter sp.]